MELSVTVPGEAVDPISYLFHRHGCKVAIEETGYDPDNQIYPPTTHTVHAYLRQTPTFHRRREMIYIGIRLLSQIFPIPPIQEHELSEHEWENQWKSHFSPLRVASRLVIKPPWYKFDPGPYSVVIDLDPGMAFGTGHHPTTFSCLESLERLIRPGMDVLDIGTGSGILAIAAAKLGAQKVIALDTDRMAVNIARANARSNGVSHGIRFQHGTVPHSNICNTTFDLILANIYARVLIDMAPYFITMLQAGGLLVASGILSDQLSEVEDAFNSAGLHINQRIQTEGPTEPAILYQYQGQDEWVTLITQPSVV